MRIQMVVMSALLLFPLPGQEAEKERPQSEQVEMKKVDLPSPVGVASAAVWLKPIEKPEGVKLPAGGEWKFMRLGLGQFEYLVAFEMEAASRFPKPKRAFVDTNRNNDLTDEKPLEPEGEGWRVAFRTQLEGGFRVGGGELKTTVAVAFTPFGRVLLQTAWEATLKGEGAWRIRWLPGQLAIMPAIGPTMKVLQRYVSYTPNLTTIAGEHKLIPRLTLKEKRLYACLKKEKVSNPNLIRKVNVPKNITFLLSIGAKRDIYLILPAGGKALMPQKARYTTYFAIVKQGNDEFAILGYARQIKENFGDIEPLRLAVVVQKSGGKYYITASLSDASDRRVYILKNGDLIEPSPVLEIKDGDKVVHTYTYSYG